MDKQNKFVMMGPGFASNLPIAFLLPFFAILAVAVLIGFGIGLLF